MAVDDHCQDNADDSGDCNSYCHAEGQDYDAQIQFYRIFKAEGLTVIQPAQNLYVGRQGSDKASQYDSRQYQQE